MWLSGHVSPDGLVRALESGVEVGSGPVLVEEPLLPLPGLDDEPLLLVEVPLGAGVRVALAVVVEPDEPVELVVEVEDVPVDPGRGVGEPPPVGIIDGDEPEPVGLDEPLDGLAEPVELVEPLDGAVVRVGVVIGSRSQLNRSLFGRD